MNALTATPKYTRASSSSGRVPAPFVPNLGVRLNGHAGIFSLAIVLALATASECQSVTHLPSLMCGAVFWVWWGCVTSAIWKLRRHFPLASSFSPRAISVHLLVGSALGVAHLLLLGSLRFTEAGWQAHAAALSIWTMLFNIHSFGIELLLYGFVFGIAGIIQFQIRARRDAMKSLELKRKLSAAHLLALQMQLEPHFLFNTLNAITTLIEFERSKEAAEMLSHLNVMLKTTLKRTIPEKVPLSQELEIMENYLAIEQVRFADRLRIEIKVEPGALDGLVPCFLLQPIVENAIRHGIANCENEGLVETSARWDGHNLHLRVRDTGRGLSGLSQKGYGIGLRNTRERLVHFYKDEFAMKAQPLDTGGFEVAITIPYERN
jgi:hypothetical protein